MQEEAAEHDRKMQIADMAMKAHDMDTQHGFQQQQQDMQAQETARQAQDRDTLTQLKIRQLSGKLSEDKPQP
jgi:hypothetical protein